MAVIRKTLFRPYVRAIVLLIVAVFLIGWALMALSPQPQAGTIPPPRIGYNVAVISHPVDVPVTNRLDGPTKAHWVSVPCVTVKVAAHVWGVVDLWFTGFASRAQLQVRQAVVRNGKTISHSYPTELLADFVLADGHNVTHFRYALTGEVPGGAKVCTQVLQIHDSYSFPVGKVTKARMSLYRVAA